MQNNLLISRLFRFVRFQLLLNKKKQHNFMNIKRGKLVEENKLK